MCIYIYICVNICKYIPYTISPALNPAQVCQRYDLDPSKIYTNEDAWSGLNRWPVYCIIILSYTKTLLQYTSIALYCYAL